MSPSFRSDRLFKRFHKEMSSKRPKTEANSERSPERTFYFVGIEQVSVDSERLWLSQQFFWWVWNIRVDKRGKFVGLFIQSRDEKPKKGLKGWFYERQGGILHGKELRNKLDPTMKHLIFWWLTNFCQHPLEALVAYSIKWYFIKLGIVLVITPHQPKPTLPFQSFTISTLILYTRSSWTSALHVIYVAYKLMP